MAAPRPLVGRDCETRRKPGCIAATKGRGLFQIGPCYNLKLNLEEEQLQSFLQPRLPRKIDFLEDFMKDKSDQLNTTLVAIISAHWPVRAIVKVASINIPSTRNHEFEAISQSVTLSPQAQIRTPNQQFKENPKI